MSLNHQENDIGRIAAARTETALFAELSRISRELGFEHCSYGMRVPLPVARPQFSLLSDYSPAWSSRYVEKNYFVIDPTVRHGLTQTVPLAWAADHQQGQPEFWEEARQHQLRHGWCVPSRGHHGTIGLLSFVRSAERLGERELLAHEPRMIRLGSLAHGAMSSLLTPRLMPESRVVLTARERETLQWTAAGKTYSEVATILSIDARTVKFHLVNAMTKLRAANKTEAAVKATMLGLLG